MSKDANDDRVETLRGEGEKDGSMECEPPALTACEEERVRWRCEGVDDERLEQVAGDDVESMGPSVAVERWGGTLGEAV